jgi:hypothetical protein
MLNLLSISIVRDEGTSSAKGGGDSSFGIQACRQKGGEGALAREKKILASQVSKTRLGAPAENVNRAFIRPYGSLSVRFEPLQEFVSGLSA